MSMAIWQTILITIGGNAAVLAVLGILARSLINGLLAKDLTKFEIELKARSDSTIERLKNELQIATIEHQIRFSRLHEKRGEVIAELYKKLVEAIDCTEIFSATADMEKFPKTFRKIKEFTQFFDKHRIYFPESICLQLEDIGDKIRSPTIGLGVFSSMEQPNPKIVHEQFKAWKSAWKSIKEQVPSARKEIENEFRKILEG